MCATLRGSLCPPFSLYPTHHHCATQKVPLLQDYLTISQHLDSTSGQPGEAHQWSWDSTSGQPGEEPIEHDPYVVPIRGNYGFLQHMGLWHRLPLIMEVSRVCPAFPFLGRQLKFLGQAAELTCSSSRGALCIKSMHKHFGRRGVP